MATNSPTELLSHLETNQSLGIYFLDIHLSKSMSGLQLAAKIRDYDPRGFIIFITSHSEMSYLTFQYKLEALDFILKDKHSDIAKRVSGCLINIQKKYTKSQDVNQKMFQIKTRDKLIQEPYESILYFTTTDNVHKIVMHALNRRVEFYSTLKQLEQSLDNRFYRCKDSCIVNKNLITSIDHHKKIVYMINGESCSASVRLIKGLKKAMEHHQ